MRVFEIVNILREYCEANNITLLYGSKAYQNAIADRKKYGANDLILLAEFRAKTEYNGYKRNGITWAGLLALGQVKEESTRSSLDELWLQKFDRRLQDLSVQLEKLLSDILCANEIDVESTDWDVDLNNLNLNADFVVCSLTLSVNG